MIEVFVGFTRDSNIAELEQTLEAWEELEDCEVVAIQCPPKRYELYRRITAENLARADYLLADLGCVPEYGIRRMDFGSLLAEDIGMFGLTGVRWCRRGIITKWPAKRTDTYDEEHVEAYKLAGYKVQPWDKLPYRRLGAS